MVMLFKQWISKETLFYHVPEPLVLESGCVLSGITLAYRTWGMLNEAGNNAILVCHALTGSSDADDWFSGFFGEGHVCDPARHYIVCINVLGSCYGSTGPTSLNPATNKPYGSDFPSITVRDIVKAQAMLARSLGIHSFELIFGGSLGGMQVLEWALLFPDMVKAIVPIATTAKHSPWAIGLSDAQRSAICADANWQGGHYYQPYRPPAAGLATARMIAMCTYRSKASFDFKFARRHQDNREDLFAIESYLRYQGDKLVKRFDANSYIILSKSMDSHDISRGRGGDVRRTLSDIHHPALVVSITSDVLYWPAEQEELVEYIPNAESAVLNSPHGHDAFLIDMAVLDGHIVRFLQRSAELKSTASTTR
jgi:homoserine O-acetyltransferase